MDQLLTKQELAARWRVKEQTIDRLRRVGRLPWLNLATSGTKPCVRFRLADVEEFERQAEIRGTAAEDLRQGDMVSVNPDGTYSKAE